MNFEGRTVLVTGASRGIGRAIAQRFAEQGARVAVHYHTNQTAAQYTLSLLGEGGHALYQADIRDPEQVQALVTSVTRDMGRLDILVNNAGIYTEHSVTEVNYAEWQAKWAEVLTTNLISAANLCYCAAQVMVRQGNGRIINVSSRGAFRGEPYSPAYGASKAGMNAMGQSLAVALAPHNIQVMTVAPGWVETDMAREFLNGPGGEAIRNQSPMGRVAKPEEVAHAVLLLAADDAAFMTGAIVDVNGASYLRT